MDTCSHAAPSACTASNTNSDSPSRCMPRSLLGLFATASGLSVANVYYAQPLLDAMADDFGIAHAAIGGVVTATQAGCALALLLIVPLGDSLERRRLMLAQLMALVVALLAVAVAHTPAALLAAMLCVGMLGTAMTQGLIAYAASAAPNHERGRVVGAAGSGVFVGLLLARVFAGAVSDVTGWRGVYAASAAVMLVLGIALSARLPRLPATRDERNYVSLLVSMLGLLRSERVLHIRGVLALLMFASLNIFWSALVLPLSAPQFNLSHTQIGAFGLVGACGAFAASRAGHWADKGYEKRTSAGALGLLLLAWLPAAQLNPTHYGLAALIAGIVLLDIGGQALHVTNQSLILRGRSTSSRLIGLYMLFYATGSGLGAMSTTFVYAHAGWQGVCLLGAGVSFAACLFWMATQHLVRQPS
uniref:Major facilitator superfamily MFS_1 n=1 Tax=Burkholderia sp. (strain CCGE1003) TaxID=640512 RepID=E1THM7_BURSG